MELFYCKNIEDGLCRLDPEESGHCIKVLRHRSGVRISVIDGEGTFYDCTLIDDSPKCAVARIDSVQRCWGAHNYNLTMAVCPTKNIDRYEWFAEKATEMGIDTIVPAIGEHSERKVVKTDRLRKILLSASKQSLKGAIPSVLEPESVLDFISRYSGSDALKLIACCFEDESHPRCCITDALIKGKEIVILIGPEGDFSHSELQAALAAGFVPVHLGESRLRTETAALAAVSAVYFAHASSAYSDKD